MHPIVSCKRHLDGARKGATTDSTIDINSALRALLEGLLNAVADEQGVRAQRAAQRLPRT